MTPEELESLPEHLERIMSELEIDAMSEVVERIKATAEITPISDWLINRMNAVGVSNARIKKQIKEASGLSATEVDKIFHWAAESDSIRNQEIYRDAGLDPLSYKNNAWLKNLVDAVSLQTQGTFENITKTTGFMTSIGRGKKVFTPFSEYLQRSLDKAMLSITTGMQTYNKAIQQVIDEMTRSGLRTVDYASGKSDRIEVAARRAAMTGLAQLADKMNEHNAEKLDTDYWEVDWHMGARNTGSGYMNHQSWQGKVYSSAEMKTVCGLGEMLGFAGIYCYHFRSPFVPGISERKYTDEWLTEQNNKENRKREFHGKQYDIYGALQYQRKLERTMRKQKQDIKLMEKAGVDAEDIISAKCRYRLTARTYTELSSKMELRQQRERLYTGIDKSVKSSIIESREMLRKLKTDTIEPMPKKQLHKIIKRFRANGGIMQIDSSTEAYLESKNAEGITYDAKTILLRKNPGRASVFEELIHATQYRIGKNDGSYANRILCEIEAQEKLIRHQKAYRLTDPEIEQTKKALKSYEKELEAYKKGEK